MITFAVQLNTKDVTNWVKALDRVVDRAHYWADRDGGELNKRCAKEYADKIVLAIYSKQHAYTPYTARYAMWKQKVGKWSGGFWNLKGDLIKALTHFREENGWKGGIPADVMDTGGKSWLGNLDKGPSKPIAMYGIVMEFGGNYGKAGYHTERPLFWPVYKDYAAFDWRRNQWVAMQDIGRYWR